MVNKLPEELKDPVKLKKAIENEEVLIAEVFTFNNEKELNELKKEIEDSELFNKKEGDIFELKKGVKNIVELKLNTEQTKSVTIQRNVEFVEGVRK